jgi:hypothetical protein
MITSKDLEAYRDEFADFCAHMERRMKRELPQLTQVEILGVIGISLFAELRQLRRFTGLVLKAHRNDGWPGDVDGDDLQDWALQRGLIEERQMSEPCGETCTCAEGADFPTTCYFNTELGKAVIAAAREQG